MRHIRIIDSWGQQKGLKMPGDSLSLLEKIASLVGILGASWLAIFKYMGISKDNEKFKKEVNTTVNALKVEVKKVSGEVVDIRDGVTNNFSVHRDYLHENYPDRKEVQQGFDAQKNDREHMLTLVMDKLDTLTASQEKIDNFITKRRDEKMAADAKTIEGLQRELRDKK